MIREHHRQTDFLQSLILLCENEQAGELLNRLDHARHEDLIMRVAVLLSILPYGFADSSAAARRARVATRPTR